MAYVCELGGGRQLAIVNQGTQTTISISSSSSGQQQQSSTGFTTGNWSAPPTVFYISGGVIIRIETEKSQHFIQIQAGGISTLNTPPALTNAEVLPLKLTADPPIISMGTMKPMEPMKMEPMKPMEPMKMGNMQMQMNPMQMQMGNMKMQIGEQSQEKQVKHFCTQCGNAVKESDRFCASCGNPL